MVGNDNNAYKQLTIEISKRLNINKYKIEQHEKWLNKLKDSDKNIHKQECKTLQKLLNYTMKDKLKQRELDRG